MLLLPIAASGQVERSLQVGDETVRFVMYPGPAGAAAEAVAVATNLHKHLVSEDLVSAALLSNAPRRRYEVLREYQARVGSDEFKRVYDEYFSPSSRILAEVAIEPHRLLIWEIGPTRHLVGQYYVRIEGRMLLDDVPSRPRQQLRAVLEAFRSGQLKP